MAEALRNQGAQIPQTLNPSMQNQGCLPFTEHVHRSQSCGFSGFANCVFAASLCVGSVSRRLPFASLHVAPHGCCLCPKTISREKK